MNPLEIRKRLLVAESDLLRVRLSEDFESLRSVWEQSGIRGRFWSDWVASLAAMVTGLGSLRSGISSDPVRPRSWVSRWVQGAGLLSSVWLAWKRARGGRHP
ncbi:MAG: hypothetical protein RLZZ34_2246 [Verrucomicrobiota bacterium]|jgi:hypothetical protein